MEKTVKEVKVFLFFVLLLGAVLVLGCANLPEESSLPPSPEIKKNIQVEKKEDGTARVIFTNKDFDGGGAIKDYDPKEISAIGIGSDVQGWPPSSSNYPKADFSSSSTITVVEGIKPNDQGKVRFTPFLLMKNGEVIYFDLTQWKVNGSRIYIVDDGTGGYIIEINFSNLPVSDTTPPEIPQGVVATHLNGGVIVSWNQNATDTAGYLVYINTVSGTPGTEYNVGNVASYTFTGLTNGTRYYFYVRAYDSAGNKSGFSIEVSAIPQATTTDTTPPSAPTNLRGSDGGGVVNLSWEAVNASDLGGYQVYWGGASGNWPNSSNVGNRTSIQLSGFQEGMTYFFVVKAYDSSGNFSSPSNEISVTIGKKKAIVIKFELPSGVTDKVNITLSTSDLDGAHLMSSPTTTISKVFWGSDLTGWGEASSAWVTYSSNPETVISNVPINNGHVRGNFGIITSKNEVIYAKLTEWETDPAQGIVSDGQGGLIIDLQLTGTPSPPSNFQAQSVTTGQVDLSWKKSPPPARGYVIYIGDDSQNFPQQKDVGDVSSHSFAGYSSGAQKCFIIKAYDSANPRNYSSAAGPVCVTVK